MSEKKRKDGRSWKLVQYEELQSLNQSVTRELIAYGSSQVHKVGNKRGTE